MSSTPTATYTVAIIGAGRPVRTQGATGFGMAHRHMNAYKATGRCTLAAVADLSRENAEAFVADHNPDARVFADAVEMMRDVRPDVVSVCLWPHLHAEVVCAIAPFKPKAILCEKPMDVHWDAALRMHEACREHGVMLAINHQRRFNLPLLKMKQLVSGGAIGKLLRIEGAWGNLADSGTHALDMMFYFNDDTPAEWVLGQIDMRGARRVFGGINAGHGMSEFRFTNGVRAMYHFGLNHQDFGAIIRLIGDEGVIELLGEQPWTRMRRWGEPAWQGFDEGESIHDNAAIDRGVADLLHCLETGGLPQLASERALRATEVIFATHESSRRRARIDLPLPPCRCAMLEMLEAGDLTAEIEEVKF